MRFFVFFVGIFMSVASFCHGAHEFGKDLIGKRYVSRAELFLYERNGPRHTTLSPPGWTSDVPPSIECYRADPENWMHSKEARSKCVSSDIERVKILAVLPAGTRIRIGRFEKRKNSLIGTFYHTYGKVEDPRFSSREVRFFALFDGTGGRDLNPRPQEEFLRPADS
jgi:hypothetical protein